MTAVSSPPALRGSVEKLVVRLDRIRDPATTLDRLELRAVGLTHPPR